MLGEDQYGNVIKGIVLEQMKARTAVIEKQLRLLPLGWYLCVHKNDCHGVPWIEVCDGIDREVMGPMTKEIWQQVGISATP